MELVKLVANLRSQRGAGPARRLRHGGKIPAVAYGKGHASVALEVSPKDLVSVLGSELGRNSVIELDLEGTERLTVLLNDFQYHPVTRSLLHADFLRIALDQPVDVDVPLELLGKPQGVVMGGVLRQVFRKLPVRCLPDKIPVKLEHDVTALEKDAHVAVRDLSLPEGVSVRLPESQTIAAVVSETRRGMEQEEGPADKTAAPAAAAEAPADKA